jgi:hypothetical protein
LPRTTTVAKAKLAESKPLQPPVWVKPKVPYVFINPENTAGQSKMLGIKPKSSTQTATGVFSPTSVFYVTTPQHTNLVPQPSTIISNVPPKPVSRSVYYKRNKLEETGEDENKRKYVRTQEYHMCRKCKNLKTPESGHVRCGTYGYCPIVEVISVDE